MNTSNLFSMLDKALPDEQIIKDLSNTIWQEKESGGIDIEVDDRKQFIPENISFDIVTKALFKEHYNLGFGTYRVMVAIGGIKSCKHGVLIANCCFATLYYNDKCQVITVDFHDNMR